MSFSSVSSTSATADPGQSPRAELASVRQAIASPVVLPAPACADPACRCHGRGGLLVFTAPADGHSRLPQHAQQYLRGRCVGAIKGEQAQPQPSGQRIQLLYGDRLLASLQASSSSITCTAILLQLRELDARSFRQAASSACSILMIHQPPTLTAVEAVLSELIPSNAEDVSVDRDLSPDPFAPPPQLLVHPNGWALGGFLMRAALLRQRSQWQSVDSAPPSIAPRNEPGDHPPQRKTASTSSRRSLLQHLFVNRGRL